MAVTVGSFFFQWGVHGFSFWSTWVWLKIKPEGLRRFWLPGFHFGTGF